MFHQLCVNSLYLFFSCFVVTIPPCTSAQVNFIKKFSHFVVEELDLPAQNPDSNPSNIFGVTTTMTVRQTNISGRPLVANCSYVPKSCGKTETRRVEAVDKCPCFRNGMYNYHIARTCGHVLYLILNITLTWILNLILFLAQLNPSSNPKILNSASGKKNSAGNIISLLTNILTMIEVQGHRRTQRESEKRERQRAIQCPGRHIIFLLHSWLHVILCLRRSHSRDP